MITSNFPIQTGYNKSEIDKRLNTYVVDHTVYMSTLFNVSEHTVTFNRTERSV